MYLQSQTRSIYDGSCCALGLTHVHYTTHGRIAQFYAEETAHSVFAVLLTLVVFPIKDVAQRQACIASRSHTHSPLDSTPVYF